MSDVPQAKAILNLRNLADSFLETVIAELLVLDVLKPFSHLIKFSPAEEFFSTLER